jgi:SAM-dependent methyltransferase
MVKEKYLRRYFVNKTINKNKSLIKGKILEIGSGERWRQFKDSITLNIDSSAKPDVVADGGRLPFKNGTFDAVMCLEVLEHTTSPVKMIDEIGRVLKKEGVLILTVPFMFEVHCKEDYYRYTKEGLSKLLSNKFKKVKVDQNGGYFCVLAHLLRISWIGKYFFFMLNNLGVLLDYLAVKKSSSRTCLGYSVIAKK